MKKLIATIVNGSDAKAYSELCIPSIKAYAEFCGADFKVYDESIRQAWVPHPTPHFDIYDIFYEFEHSDYDWLMFMDADIIVQKGTPNIFEEFEYGTYLRQGWEWKKEQDWIDEVYKTDLYQTWDKYWSSGVVLITKEDIKKFNYVWINHLKIGDKFEIGPWQGEMGTVNFFLAQTDINVQILPGRWHFTRVWADGYKGMSLEKAAGVKDIRDIYLQHYAGCGNKVIAIKKDLKQYGYMGFDDGAWLKSESNVNVGVYNLHISNRQLTAKDAAFKIEDNLGEAVHCHFGTLRLDFTIRDFIIFAQACQKTLEELYKK